MPDMGATYFKIDNREYVILPRREYEKLAGIPAGTEDALAFSSAVLASDVKAARLAAGLSQAELAKKLKISQPMVARAEAGETRVGTRYMANVLKACGLPKTWKPEE